MPALDVLCSKLDVDTILKILVIILLLPDFSFTNMSHHVRFFCFWKQSPGTGLSGHPRIIISIAQDRPLMKNKLSTNINNGSNPNCIFPQEQAFNPCASLCSQLHYSGGVISQLNDALDQWPQGLTARRHL